MTTQVTDEVKQQYEKLRTTFWEKVKLNIKIILCIFVVYLNNKFFLLDASSSNSYHSFLIARYFWFLLDLYIISVIMGYLNIKNYKFNLWQNITLISSCTIVASLILFHGSLLLWNEFLPYLDGKIHYKWGIFPQIFMIIVALIVFIISFYSAKNLFKLLLEYKITDNCKIIEIQDTKFKLMEYKCNIEFKINGKIYSTKKIILDYKLAKIINKKMELKIIYSINNPENNILITE